MQSDGAPHTDWTVPERGGRYFLYPLHWHQGARQVLAPIASLSWTDGIGCLGFVCHIQIVLFLRGLTARTRSCCVVGPNLRVKIPGVADVRGEYLGPVGPMQHQ